MQYTTHYNLNLPEGTDIVNPLIQDNPNYSAIDTALYDNKLRAIGNATHTKTGTNHAITLADSDIAAFKFVATGDYATGDTFTVDGTTVTARVADGSTIPSGAFKINSTVLAALDGTILNLINITGTQTATSTSYDNSNSGLSATNVQDAIDEIAIKTPISYTVTSTKTYSECISILNAMIDRSKISRHSKLLIGSSVYHCMDIGTLKYTRTVLTQTTFDTRTISFDAPGYFVSAVGTTLYDDSNSNVGIGTVFKLYY